MTCPKANRTNAIWAAAAALAGLAAGRATKKGGAA